MNLELEVVTIDVINYTNKNYTIFGTILDKFNNYRNVWSVSLFEKLEALKVNGKLATNGSEKFKVAESNTMFL